MPFSRRSQSNQSKRPHGGRRLRVESLEHRRVMAGGFGVCVAAETVEVASIPNEESVVPPYGPQIRRDAFDQKGRPFQISGGEVGTPGIPLTPGVTSSFTATGNATGLGKYTGEGTFTLESRTITNTGIQGTFSGTFVFVAANGDRLATTFGDGASGTFTSNFGPNGTLVDVEFDAFFRPDPVNSTGRFARAVGGGWRMIAKADSISLAGPQGFTAPFDFSWSGRGTLEFTKK